MSVVSGADQDPVRIELSDHRDDHPLHRLAVDIPTASGRERQVDDVIGPVLVPILVDPAGSGIERVLVKRQVDQIAGLVERVLGSIAVVDVPIDDRHLVSLVGQKTGGNGHIVEHTEAHGPILEGVVAGRTDGKERSLGRTLTKQIYCSRTRPGCSQG